MRDLLTKDGLIERKKLHLFTKNPVVFKHSETRELHQAYFEHCLREIIRDFFSVVQELSKADLEYYRTFALDMTE